MFQYRKVKDGNRKSGNGVDSSFIYLEEMDAVLGTKAVSEPPLLLDSGVPHTIIEDIVHGQSFYFQINYSNFIWIGYISTNFTNNNIVLIFHYIYIP